MHYVGSLAPETPTYAVLRDLPPGFETRATLRYMRDFARLAVADPAQQIRTQALMILKAADVAPRDWRGEAAALQTWVRDNIRFQNDPEEFELLQTPQKTLEFAAGDCDDQATLLAALLSSVGHPSEFIAIGFDGEPFSHVLVRTKIADQWVPAETILPNAVLGWWPNGVTSHYRLKV